VLRKIAVSVKAGHGLELHQNPVSTPRRRLDEVKAAKELKLTF
jgi:hypothetical protein